MAFATFALFVSNAYADLGSGIARAFAACAGPCPQAPVILTVAEAPALGLQQTEQIGVYSIQDNALRAIAFQIDHKDFAGEFVLGPAHEAERSRERADSWKARRRLLEAQGRDEASLAEERRRWLAAENLTTFDGGDELVFMAWDAGNKAATLPEGPAWLEVEVRIDSSTVRYAYVAVGDTGLAASDVDYVAFDPATQTVRSAFAEIGFAPERPIVIESFRDRISPSELSTDFLDRFKLRLEIKPVGFFGISFHEDDVESRTIAYKDGPIRVIRRNLFWLEFLFIRVTPKAFANYIFYPNMMLVPIVVHVPFDPNVLLRKGSQVVIGFDHNRNALGTRMWSEHSTIPAILDGQLAEGERPDPNVDTRWFAMQRPWGSLMSVEVEPSESIRSRGLTIQLAYEDDPDKNEPPEAQSGEYFAGIRADVLMIPPGEHKMSFLVRFRPGFARPPPVGERPFNETLEIGVTPIH